jgi:hypothetical protein
MHHNKAFILSNGGKASFFIATKPFFWIIIYLEITKKNFLKNKIERDIAPRVLSSEYLYNEISKYEGIVFCFHSSKQQKFLGYGVKYFWSLILYWKTNVIGHNLNSMYIRKNIFLIQL